MAKRILEALSLGLKLTKEDHDKLFALHSGHNNQLRLLHYPSVDAKKLQQQVIGRMPAHQDWSSFTFLFQDDVGGLELEDPRMPGSFIPAKPLPGTCVLNVGDMLQRFSNGMTDCAAICAPSGTAPRCPICDFDLVLI
jgi:isopenicillin N synthase-like dioxygenase